MTDEEKQTKLEKIRGLLRQAEATTYPEEAKAFSEAAQRLMTKYAFDELEVSLEERHDTIETRDFKVMEPYGNQKMNLLGAIARNNDAKLVQGHKAKYLREKDENGRWRFVSGKDDAGIKRSKLRYREAWITGFTSDLDRIEMLYSSLLIQMNAEMLATPTPSWENGVSFRNSFVAGYTSGIGGRLRSSRSRATKEWEAEHGTSVALVVLEKNEQVKAAYDERWGGQLRKVSTSYARGSGHGAGRSAANRADVGNARISGRKALGSGK